MTQHLYRSQKNQIIFLPQSQLLLFLDTEYTGLGQVSPKLISIALVPEDGKNIFYAELKMGDGWAKTDCSKFVLMDVLPRLIGGDFITEQSRLKERILEWFASMPRSLQIACDSETDFHFLKKILGKEWPSKLKKNYFDLRPLVDTTIYNQTVQNYYDNSHFPHNALTDAQSYRRAWLAWMDWNKRRKS